MPDVPLRIRFTDDLQAYEAFHTIMPEHDESITGHSRKRDGASHVVLLALSDRAALSEFIAVCRQHPHVTEVTPITEAEFWAAPSNAI